MVDRSLLGSLAVAVAATLACSSAIAAEPAAPAAPAWNFANVTIVNAPGAATDEASPSAIGMRAFKDKDTGRLRNPSAEEIEELAAAAPAAVAAPTPVQVRTLSSGMMTATLDESYLSYSVATKSATGEVKTDCAADAHEAEALINAAPAQGVTNDR